MTGSKVLIPLTRVDLARIKKYDAEAEAYIAERKYNDLQAERLIRVRKEEDSSPDSQRILDFASEVTDGSVYRAIGRLTEWRHRSHDPIIVRINSGGGDIISGLALYDHILELRGDGIEVTTIGTGMVASMAGILFQAGSRRLMTPGCWMMIHELSTFNEGKLSEVIDYTKWLERVQADMVKILAERSTLTVAQIKARTAKGKDYWINAEEAVKFGFADGITTDVKAI